MALENTNNPITIPATSRPSTGFLRVRFLPTSRPIHVLDTDTDYELVSEDQNFFLAANGANDVLLSNNLTPDGLPDLSRFGFVR